MIAFFIGVINYKAGLLLVSVTLCLSHHSVAQVTVSYDPPINEIEQALQRDMQASVLLQSALQLIQQAFILNKPLHIVFGETPKAALSDGPYYHRNKISIPYRYVYRMRQFLSKRKHIHRESNIDQLIFRSLTHAFFHEFGHALIDQYGLAITGLEEDTVDNLANFLSIEFFDRGSEIAYGSAVIFKLKSKTGRAFQQKQFRSEHRLPIQRYYSILCHIYGADPNKQQSIISLAGFSEKRATKCIREYKQLSTAWADILVPYLR